MKALVMVAHPDDCVIFAWSFMHHYDRLDWQICYLTYRLQDPRAQELVRFWARKNIVVSCLGHTDDYRDLETNQCSFDVARANQDIKQMVQDVSLVLTHDHKGDYGHVHHKFVHDAVRSHHPAVVTFADTQSGNAEYSIKDPDYSPLLIHRSIVESFHRDGHRNRYLVSPSAQSILQESYQ